MLKNVHNTDERVLKEIVVRNVSCVNDNNELKRIIHYWNKRVLQLIVNKKTTKKK